jgi:integrase
MATSILFSRAALAAIKPNGKRQYFKDTRESKLLLDVTPAGTKIFQVYMKHDGRPVRVTLGRFNDALADSVELPKDCSHTRFLANNPELNVRMARTLAGLVKIDIKSGTNPTEAKKAKRDELTLGELFDEFESRHLIPEGKKGASKIRGDFERLLGAMPDTPRKKHGRQRAKSPGSVNWQNRPISSIERTDIGKLRASLAKLSSTENANRALKLLKSMYNRAIDWKLFAKENPVEDIPLFRTIERERYLAADELPRFFASIAAEANPDIRDYFFICLLTGVRKSNVLEMRWADVNFARGTVVFPKQVTKNGDPLTLPLGPEVIEILKARKPKKAATFVFPGTGESGHMVNPRKGWQRVLDRDELSQLADRIRDAGGEFKLNITDQAAPDFDYLAIALRKARALAAEFEIDTNGTRLADLRPHDLRRTLGSWQSAGNASLQIIGKSLGHKAIASTLIYARLNLDPVRASVAAATTAILEAAGVKKSADVKRATKST